MAREEHDKEDLLREATALVERAEWQVEGFPDSVVAGFRRNRAVSFFFSVDPVYQFNEAGELRRGYQGGKLLKADGGNLIRLTRQRSAGGVHLLRHELTESDTTEYLTQLEDHLTRLQSALAAGDYRLIGQHPAQTDVAARVLAWLAQRPRPTTIARRPNA